MDEGIDDLTSAGDEELNGNASAQAGRAHQLLIVAVLHLVHVQANHASDDLLVQGATDGDDACAHPANLDLGAGAEAAEARVVPVAIAAEGVEVAQPDGREVHASAARTGSGDAPTANAVAIGELVSNQIAEDVLLRIADRRIAAKDVRELRGLGRSEHAKNALVEDVGRGFGLAEMHVFAIAFDGIRPRGLLRVPVTHLARVSDVRSACLAWTLVRAVAEHLRGLLWFGWTDGEGHKGSAQTREVTRHGSSLGRDREDHEQKKAQADEGG